MSLFRRYKYVLIFLAVLAFSSAMVLRQLNANQSRHVELREAFILLHTCGYTNESRHLFERLLNDLPRLSNVRLMDDFQRTLLLVDPEAKQTNNPIWVYHWTVSNELEKRSESTLKRALKLASEP